MRRLPLMLIPLLLLGAACGDDDGSAASEAATSTTEYDPGITPADFSDPAANEYFPLTPGSRWVYEGRSEDGLERVEVTVTDDTKEVMGIEATVVRDTVTVDGEIVEDTLDWFAADNDGNVWYFGEDVENFENGQLQDTDGSWEAGVDGALPGIVMQADPQPGQHYLQEYYPGEAVDEGTVLRVGEDEVTVPAGTFDQLLVTEDVNPLEPGIVENKFYAPGVGLVAEEKVQGGDERVELLEFEVA
jgi:hypothetical protein